MSLLFSFALSSSHLVYFALISSHLFCYHVVSFLPFCSHIISLFFLSFLLYSHLFFLLISSFLLRSLTILFRLHLVSFVLIFSSLLLSSHPFFALSSSHLILLSFLLYSHLFFLLFSYLILSSSLSYYPLQTSSCLFCADLLIFSLSIMFLFSLITSVFLISLISSSLLRSLAVSSHLISCTLLLCSHLVSLSPHLGHRVPEHEVSCSSIGSTAGACWDRSSGCFISDGSSCSPSAQTRLMLSGMTHDS